MTPTETEFLNLYKDVYKYSLYLCRDPEEAREITQDTYLKALAAKDRYIPGTNAKGWLFRIMYNCFIDLCKRKKKFQFGKFESIYEDNDNTDNFFVYEDDPFSEHFSDEVLEAFNQLTDKQKQLIVFVDIYGLKYDEVMKIFNLPGGTMRSSLFVARRKMEKHLRKSGEYKQVRFNA